MALSRFLAKLNWRLMLIHLCACWFFIYSFQTLSYLHDHNSMLIVLKYPGNPEKWRFGVDMFTIDVLWITLSKYVGLLAAFLISLVICFKRNWLWLNSLIVFIVCYLLSRFKLFGWYYLSYIFLSPGRLFKEYSVGFFLVNGVVMLIIGLALFFLDYSAKFINGNHKADDSPVAPSTI